MRGASKRFDGEVALEDASLEVRAGEVHALMGENGAGKSTLIKLLAGVETPDAMQLEVLGRPEHVGGPGDAGRLGLRFIHQELNVVPALSVAENIFLGHDYPRRMTGLVDWRALRARARDTLAGLGVRHIDPAVPMSRLGTGDAMLVSIARAFVEPAGAGERGLVYVMDEPTAALSRHETQLLFEVVRGLRSRGAGVLYVSHRMEEIFEIADRITVLRDGRVVRTVASEDATREGLIHAMTGRALDGSYGGASQGGPQDDARAGAPALEARELRTADLHGVSLKVWPGEVVGVTGLAGSGRTELLRALLGADPLREGQVLLAGQEVHLEHPAEAWAAGLAYVPEERRSQALAMGADVRRNLLLPHLARVSTFGVADRRRERREADAWGREVGLRARGPHQAVHELSGGNQQKVVLARALAARPRVLLLDEPTRGVDVGAKADIYRLVRQAAADGAAVLLASSDLDEVLGVCERVLVLHEGRITHERPVATLDRGALLELCYGGAAA
ncbi:MAG: sugar ABC transporter ATP-binding protein [Trueperaceae bacterium]|nr:sugar ABC transporter ATP-binding protein [Trueperaceae bacterium]